MTCRRGTKETGRQLRRPDRGRPAVAQFSQSVPRYTCRTLRRENCHNGRDDDGHPVPVPNTPSAANNTARFPSTSFRVQIQAERMLASPARYAQSKANEIAFAESAATPTAPIVTAVRKRAVQGVPDHRSNDPQAEHAHSQSFDHGRLCAIAERHSDHEKADRVVRSIAEKVESISLQRRGTGREASANLDQEHGSIDDKYRPENPAIGAIPPVRVQIQGYGGTTMIGHGGKIVAGADVTQSFRNGIRTVGNCN